ncbi:PD-(D/E)XK nuclease superfamily protein, partial [Anaerosporobacter sp.]|uniref:PD-(D/E)XK nuclease superfamily protein n=1 Tax=Anaerosporobacter sp. TaxID=1872529 RepID=UPI00286F3C82
MRIANHFGGGARTNENGLLFEQTTSLSAVLKEAGYYVKECEVFDAEELIGLSVPQNKIYKNFLEREGIDYRKYNSKKWHPDECFVNFRNRTAYIIEKKFQNGSGSVDEKLPGCHFKKMEYQ